MKIRAVSALVAVLAFVLTYWFFRIEGLLAIGVLVSFGCIYEYARLTFRNGNSRRSLRWSFVLLCSALFLTTLFFDRPIASIAQAAIYFLTIVLFNVSSKEDLANSMQLQGVGLMGFLYVGIFPALALRILRLPEGDIWFFGLLAIVFAGDTMAYITGRFFGRRKLFEAVSPKKTIEGAFGGLFGSALAGIAIAQFLPPEGSSWMMIGAATVTGAFAQVGDLYESLIKRVADVKDSGSIMPGHGGMLDRLDGVLFAAPIYFSLLSFITNRYY
ncbi:MAG: phosphatidate cytidylyltransferase [Bdellovibrionales bacterium]|jgi:phosphatidate cytidylyltransferase|nr:phosphatidate cytidylyltransferase [Bdellovibrionales bacterium]